MKKNSVTKPTPHGDLCCYSLAGPASFATRAGITFHRGAKETKLPFSRIRVFYGWWIVAVAAVGLFFSAPTIAVYSYSVFLKAASQDFRVGRGAVALAFTFHNLGTASLTPIIGYMIDRFGAKRIVVPATALVGLTAIFAKLIGAALWQYYVFYAA